MSGQRNQRGGASELTLPTASEVPEELSQNSILVCEGRGQLVTALKMSPGGQMKKSGNGFFSSRNTPVEFPQQVSTSAFGENLVSVIAIVQPLSLCLPGEAR